jgi:hypothetical protein
LTAGDVKTCRLEVSFFGEEAAWKLIHAYADSEATVNSAYRQHPEPVRKLIGAYFNAIESALGLESGHLWLSDQGKAFAGYAPVLAAMGSLLAQLDNFQDVANKLKETGTRVAWDVIETVLNEIIDREKTKLCGKLEAQVSAPLPPETYDREEQLTLLAQFVHGQPLRGTGRVKLVGADQVKYQTMIKALVPEHPFVRNKEFGNAVLGSVVISHAIMRNLLNGNIGRTAVLSRQPFLWRTTAQMLSKLAEIDGRYIGYVLNSLWNDPIHTNCRVEIRTSGETAASISLFYNKRRALTFVSKTPITFYGQIKDCEVDLVGDVSLLGDGPPSLTAFYARGSSTIMCSTLNVDAGSIRFEGDTWLEADRVTTPPQFRIIVINGVKVGWGGNLATRHPWNEIGTTLPKPYETVADDTLTAIVVALAQRTLPGGSVILNDDYSAVPNDPHMRWATRQFSTQLPELIKLLVRHRMASHTPLGASDHGTKIKMHFEFAWWDLVSALENPEAFPAWQALIAEARKKIRN